MILHTDSFDHATDANLGLRYDSYGLTLVSTQLRSGSGYGVTLESATAKLRKDISSRSTLICGFACRCQAPGANSTVLEFMDSLTVQLSLRLNTDRTLTVLLGDGTELGTSSSVQTIPTSGYAYIEVKATFHSSAGSCEVRVNRQTWFAFTSVNTAHSGTNSANQIQLMWTSTGYLIVDDYYIADDLGGTNDDFLGPIQIGLALPNAAGSLTGWTPVGAASNYDCVNDDVGSDVDDSSTYVSASVVGTEDLYNVSDPGISGNILNVNLFVRASKSSVLARSISSVLRHAGTDDVGSSVSLDTSWSTFHGASYGVNPITNVAWTAADIAAMQIGVKVAS